MQAGAPLSDDSTSPKGQGGPAVIAIAAVLALVTGGGLGIVLGAIFDDFPLGLAIGGGFGLLMATAIGWFVMRDRGNA